MRVRVFILGISVSLVAAAVAIQACGGDTSNPSTPSDAGQEAAKEAAPQDTGSDVAVDSATCDLSTDFTTKIPDASIADGASTTGICVGCAEAHCKKDINDCNASCECKGLMDKALECYAKNSSKGTTALFACVQPFISASSQTQQIGQSLIGCLQASCDQECPVPQGPDGGDGGDGG
jgi:hypothetical protein